MKIRLNQVLSNTVWLTSGQMALRVAKILIIALAIGTLGIEGYGVISIVIAFVSVFYIPASLLHILTPMVRDFSKEISVDYKNLSMHFSWRFILAILAMVIGFLGSFFYPYNPFIFAFIGLALAFDFMKDFFNAILESKSDMKASGSIFILQAFLTLVFGLLSLKLYGTITAFALSYTLASLFALVLSFSLIRKHKIILRLIKLIVPSRKHIKNSFSEGFGFGLFWSLFTNFVFQIIIVSLSFLTSEGDVAIVSIVFQIIQALLIPYTIFAYSNIPPLSKIFGTQDFSKRLAKFIVFPFITSLPYLSISIIGVTIALPILFKDTYIPITNSFLQIGVFSFLFLPIIVSLSYALLLTDFFKKKPFFLGVLNLVILSLLLLSMFVFGKGALLFGLPVFYLLTAIILWLVFSKQMELHYFYFLLKKEILLILIVGATSLIVYQFDYFYLALIIPMIYFIFRINLYYSYFKK